MTTCSCDIYHDGRTWVLKIIPADTMEVVDVPITNAEKEELVNAGISIYED